MITAFYGALLGLIQLSLTYYVILGRWKYSVSLGDGNEKDLRRRIRAHGNFIETVPMAILLLWFAEAYIFSPPRTHFFGLLLVIGRILHLLGLLNQPKSTNRYRQVGMAITMGTTGILAVWLIVVLGAAMFLPS